MIAATQRSIKRDREVRHVSSRVDLSLNKRNVSSVCDGDRRLQNIQATLNGLGIVRSADQILFHESFTQACMPHIYGKDWASHSVRVMRERGIKKINFE